MQMKGNKHRGVFNKHTTWHLRFQGMVISTQICGKPNSEEWYSRLRGVVVLDQSTCYQRPWEIVLKTKKSVTQDRVVLKTQMCGPWDQEEWYSQPRWVVFETRRSGTHNPDEWSLKPRGVRGVVPMIKRSGTVLEVLSLGGVKEAISIPYTSIIYLPLYWDSLIYCNSLSWGYTLSEQDDVAEKLQSKYHK